MYDVQTRFHLLQSNTNEKEVYISEENLYSTIEPINMRDLGKTDELYIYVYFCHSGTKLRWLTDQVSHFCLEILLFVMQSN